MRYRLIVSKEAHKDIDEITSYIAHELNNTHAAIGFLDDVEASYRHVGEQPLMYSLFSDERLQKQGYRKIPIKNYLIIYRVDEAQKSVFVVRVIYGPRNYTEFL